MKILPTLLPASEWLTRLKAPSSELLFQLGEIYGADQRCLLGRRALLLGAVQRFLQFHDDQQVLISRAPGRINLRGMHVDTHGGYLNLMTHQREVVVVAAPSGNEFSHFVSYDEDSKSGAPDEAPLKRARHHYEGWEAFIAGHEVRQAVQANPGHWQNYALGVCVRAADFRPSSPLLGVHGVITSDLPIGACLSSSAALCTASLLALLHRNGIRSSKEQLVLAARDAEWLTGARTGTGDQTAVVCGRRGQIMHVAVLTEDYSLGNARHFPFPADLDLLVINSYTQRSLSGQDKVAYTSNRFAYSIALEVLRQEMLRAGYPQEQVASADRLSRLTPEDFGGVGRLYPLLRRIPARCPVEELSQRYILPSLDGTYARYFADVPLEHRPREISLRGPLIFALAESERARRFPEWLADNRFETAGKYMSAGHDGDRVAWGRSARPCYDDASLRALESASAPLEDCPGDYGASSPVLDAIVDEALRAGALGVCLTGAGIAGAVLALCRKQDSAAVQQRLREFLQKELQLAPEQLELAVMVNRAPAGAGLL